LRRPPPVRKSPFPAAAKFHRLAPAFAAFCCVSFLAGCSTQGDFGEVKPSLVRDDIHDWLPADAPDRAARPSRLPLTDDERQLRDLAYPLIEAPYHRQRAASVLREYGIIPPENASGFDPTAYADHLLRSTYHSPSALYSRLIDDIRNDTTRMPQFFETAARVVDIDRRRNKSFAYVSADGGEHDQAVRRMNDNANIISWVKLSLAQRASSYKFALERLVITVPSHDAVEVERALRQMKTQMAYYRSSAPTGRRDPNAGLARGD
jgi:hypothetical protein